LRRVISHAIRKEVADDDLSCNGDENAFSALLL